MKTEKLTLHIDGASRGNPGPSSVGVEIRDERGEVIHSVAKVLGITTNNVAEYFAFITGLEEAAILGAKRVEVFTDSQLLERQFSGAYKVKDTLIKLLYRHSKHLAQHFQSCAVTHVPREQNQNADRLANQALDDQI